MREFTCIGCPAGCALKVEEVNGDSIVSGNGCKVGYDYALKEMSAPMRMLTSLLLVSGGDKPVVSVKTQASIPKSMVLECAKALKGIVVSAPIKIGDVLIEDVCKTGVNIIATKEVLVCRNGM